MTQNEDILSRCDAVAMDTYARLPAVLVRAKGASAFDADGKRYVDFGSGIGVNALGYCDPEWAKAVAEQAATLSHISNYFASPVMVETAELLCSLTGMSRVFFANSGAEANECAIKLARKYSRDKYGEGRHTIVTLRDSFHGRTLATLSATGQESLHSDFRPLVEGFSFAAPGDIDEMLALMDGSVCAVMLEPVLGEGGVLPLKAEYVKNVCAAAAERDILVIFDEVQCGIGRTGTFLACEHFGQKPDILTLAKGIAGGLPMGAVLCGERLSGVLTPGSHGSTFGGNPVCCAGALTVLKRVAKPEFLAEVLRKGRVITDALAALRSPFIREVRGRGLMIGAVLKGVTAKAAVDALLRQGLIALTAKGEVLRLLPPLSITDNELAEGLSILASVFEQMGADVK